MTTPVVEQMLKHIGKAPFAELLKHTENYVFNQEEYHLLLYRSIIRSDTEAFEYLLPKSSPTYYDSLQACALYDKIDFLNPVLSHLGKISQHSFDQALEFAGLNKTKIFPSLLKVAHKYTDFSDVSPLAVIGCLGHTKEIDLMFPFYDIEQTCSFIQKHEMDRNTPQESIYFYNKVEQWRIEQQRLRLQDSIQYNSSSADIAIHKRKI